MTKLKRGYYLCLACGCKTLHDWCSPYPVQFYETLPNGQPIDDDVFSCLRCERLEWGQPDDDDEFLTEYD